MEFCILLFLLFCHVFRFHHTWKFPVKSPMFSPFITSLVILSSPTFPSYIFEFVTIYMIRIIIHGQLYMRVEFHSRTFRVCSLSDSDIIDGWELSEPRAPETEVGTMPRGKLHKAYYKKPYDNISQGFKCNKFEHILSHPDFTVGFRFTRNQLLLQLAGSA